MQRRTFLATTGALGASGGLAGCLEVAGLGDPNPDVVLDEPDRQFDSADVPYPAWGERVPDATLPAPLDGGEVTVRDVETPALLTFFYSHCNTVCPVLISTLRNVQAHARNEGYAGDVSIMPVTFDPARDTASRLRTYAEEMNVVADGSSWHFLRPASKARAKTVVQEQFGVTFERTEPENMDMYMFAHAAMTLLVNADGYVERAYRSKSPDQQQILADLETVRTA
jgi:protein SCO1/2